MGRVREFFERFEKGELRTVERELTVDTLDEGDDDGDLNSATFDVTIDRLVEVEEVYGVKLADADEISGDTPTQDEYKTLLDGNSGGAQSDPLAVYAKSIDENTVTLEFYAGDGTIADDTTEAPFVKVIAAGY